MILLVGILVILRLIANSDGYQDQYRVINDRCTLVWYNVSYAHPNVTFGLTLYNRTTRAFHFSAHSIRDIGMKLRSVAEFYKFVSNEYRPFPIKITTDVCKELSDSGFFGLQGIRKYSNIKSCPLTKGIYYLRDYVPDYTKFPPGAPPGSYKVEFKFYDDTNLLFEMHWYGRFQQIIKWQ